VVVYLRELKEIVDSLTAINSPISNKDLSLSVPLHGLPLEYEAFVTTITNMKELPSFAQLRAKLLHQEQRKTFRMLLILIRPWLPLLAQS
jgi:hypothetical protein